MTEPPEDIAGERRVAVGLVDQIDADQVREPPDVDPSVHQPGPVRGLFGRQQLLAFIGKLTRDRLENIDRRGDALERAVFVEEDRHLQRRLAQQLDEPQRVDALVHHQRLAD